MAVYDYDRTPKSAKTFKIEVGALIWYGKYKNKRGIVKEFKVNEKGDPIVVIEPVPKGRKQDKELKLFKIRPRKASYSYDRRT